MLALPTEGRVGVLVRHQGLVETTVEISVGSERESVQGHVAG